MSFKWIGKSEDGSTVTLRKLNGKVTTPDYATSDWMRSNSDLVRSGVVVDVETTGLNKTQDKVIEIGLRHFVFNRSTGEILSVGDSYSGYEDPGQPLSEEVKALTGITDSMLKGQAIDWQTVSRALTEAQVIIAHNASFDRPMIDRYVSIPQPKVWGCSLSQIDWASKGYTIRKLEVLCIYHGFFTDAHRALNDSDALLQLLSLKDATTGNSYLNELLTNARRPLVRVIASNSPFESKDALKGRSYFWDGTKRSWYKSVYKDDLNSEISWLEQEVYTGAFRGLTQEISVSDNFKGTA